MKGYHDATTGLSSTTRRRPPALAVGALLLAALLLGACGQAALTAVPDADAQPTAMPQATVAPTQEPAATVPATIAPSATVAEPTAEPATPAPTADPTAAPTSEAGATTEAMDEGEVELEDFQFVPQVLTVKVGTEVKFSNKDDVVHTVTSDTGLFDSGSLEKGEEFFYTFTEAGEYPYYCAPHGGPGGQGMSGTIVVVP